MFKFTLIESGFGCRKVSNNNKKKDAFNCYVNLLNLYINYLSFISIISSMTINYGKYSSFQLKSPHMLGINLHMKSKFCSTRKCHRLYEAIYEFGNIHFV